MATPERIDELLAKQEARVRSAFLRYVAVVQSEAVLSEVEELLENRDVAGAFRLLEHYVARFADVLPRVQQDVGEAAAAELAESSAVLIAVGFDSTHPRAAALVRTQRLGLIRELTDSQTRAVQQAINRAVGSGLGAAASARAFRDAIGLTATQEEAVANYRRLLETQNRQALDRALRDRRFDDRVRQAVENDRPLTTRQIDTMVGRYRARSLAARAETIGRTEAHRAFSEARREASEQMLEQTGIARERLERNWNTTKDERRRDFHATMEGQKRGMDEAFTDGLGHRLMYPGDPAAPAETVINCRCTETFRVRPAA